MMTETSSQDQPRARTKRNPIANYFRWFRRLWFLKLMLFLIIAALPPLILIYVTIYMPLESATRMAIHKTGDERSYQRVPAGLSDSQMEKVRQLEAAEQERVFLKNRLNLASQDSVYLVLNIPDSTISLEIKGVTARLCKIGKMVVSRRVTRINRTDIIEWISTPFTLQAASATIPKSPIVFKKAPKDTLEAQSTSSIPVPPELNSVFFTLQFDKDLLIDVEQIQPIPEDDKEIIRNFTVEKRKAIARQALNSVLHLEPPHQELRIMLWLDEADARAIYRAIPHKAQMVVKL
jgi:hypothetical protein